MNHSFFFQNYFGYLGSFEIPYEFEDKFFYSKKKKSH